MSLTGKTPLKTTVAVNDGLTPENPGNAAVHNQTRDRLNEVDILTGQVAGQITDLAVELEDLGDISGLADVAQAAAVSAKADADRAKDISGISTSDGVVKSLVADTTSQTALALAASIDLNVPTATRVKKGKSTLGGSLGRYQYKQATTPTLVKIVLNGDSNMSGADAAGVMSHRLHGLHCQQGEALDGVASIDFFSDGIGNGTTTFKSDAADFTSGDVGRTVSGRNIPLGTVIAAVVDEATVTLNKNATTGTGLQFRVGRHIISGGNSGMPLAYWLANPNFTGVNGPYNQAKLFADNPDLVVAQWLTNDVRQGGLGLTVDAIFTAGRALLKTYVDLVRANLPNADILLMTPATFLSANVGDTGHPAPYDFINDGAGNVNPAGLAQVYSTALRRIYLSFLGEYPNVDVIDTQGEVFGTRSLATHPLMANQIHPNPSDKSDLFALNPLNGGYVAAVDAVATRIGAKRNAFAPSVRRARHEFIVYDGPSSGTVRLVSRDVASPAPQAAINRASTLFINGISDPISLASATIQRGFSTEFIELTGGALAGIDFSPFVGRTAMASGAYSPAVGEALPISVTVGTVTANSRKTISVTVPGAAPGNLGHRGRVEVNTGAAFNASALLPEQHNITGTDTVKVVVENPTASDVTVGNELWTFTVFR